MPSWDGVSVAGRPRQMGGALVPAVTSGPHLVPTIGNGLYSKHKLACRQGPDGLRESAPPTACSPAAEPLALIKWEISSTAL